MYHCASSTSVLNQIHTAKSSPCIIIPFSRQLFHLLKKFNWIKITVSGAVVLQAAGRVYKSLSTYFHSRNTFFVGIPVFILFSCDIHLTHSNLICFCGWVPFFGIAEIFCRGLSDLLVLFLKSYYSYYSQSAIARKNSNSRQR